LGIRRESVYENCYYPFDSASRVFLYTDGVYEVKNQQGEEFTVERLQNVVAMCKEESPARLIQCVSDTITKFTDARPNEDDLTLVTIQG
jgi:sigma-B regulation protein RsbU (phosphoserine phosphatase)